MDTDLLDRFYKGECSPEEVRTVLQWFRTRSMRPEQEQQLQAMWQEAGETETEQAPEHDAAVVFRKIKSQLPVQGQPEEEKPAAVVRVLCWKKPQFWFKVAAAVLLPLCFVWLLVQYVSQPDTLVAKYALVEAAPGIRKTVRLPDGSVIRLNSGSSLTFLKSFNADKREVFLRGEAFFEVAKNRLRPFIVHTGSISTQALGTSFNINYRACEDITTVALATGVVKIEQRAQARRRQIARLVPGQQLAYNKVSKHYAVAAFNQDEVLGWKEGLLYFKGASGHQVIKKLENWYGVDIEVDARGLEDEAWNYTGEYDNEKLETVLEGIGFVKGFTYKRTANKVKIVFN